MNSTATLPATFVSYNIISKPLSTRLLKSNSGLDYHFRAPYFRNGVTETEPPTFIGLEEEDGPVTLRPNRFRPQAGIRNRLRNRLHEVLEEEEDDDDEKPSNSPPRY